MSLTRRYIDGKNNRMKKDKFWFIPRLIFIIFYYTSILLFSNCSSEEKMIQHEKVELLKMEFVKKAYEPNLIKISSCGFHMTPNFPILISKIIFLNKNTKTVAAQPIGGAPSIQSKLVYPELAKRAGIYGVVVLEYEVDDKGNTQNIIVIKGIGGLCEENAVESIRHTKFAPATLNGTPIKTNYRIIIQFVFPPEIVKKEIEIAH